MNVVEALRTQGLRFRILSLNVQSWTTAVQSNSFLKCLYHLVEYETHNVPFVQCNLLVLDMRHSLAPGLLSSCLMVITDGKYRLTSPIETLAPISKNFYSTYPIIPTHELLNWMT